MYTILVHISNQDPVKVDVDDLPKPTDTCLIGQNPRDRGDGEVRWVDEGVSTIILPWWRINFIQVLPSGDEQLDFPNIFRE
ncbi:MAG: hypothetical protein KC496_06400 [Anaerolineae bacterium]|nr:hypothetical protein [Anaerolineae bacterium]